MSFLFVANLAIAGIYFVQTEPTSEENDLAESVNPGLDLSHDIASPDYDVDSVGWSKNIVIMSPRREATEQIANIGDEEEISETPEIINEDNTPIFLNAVSGIFFPICHTSACTKDNETEEDFLKLLNWQKSFYRIQVVIFNIVILSVLGVIYTLVTSVNTFNYNFNVLSLFWFKSAFLFLVFMGLLTFILSIDIDLTKLWSSISCSPPNMSQPSSSSASVCRQAYVCLLSILLISLPAILGIVSFNMAQDQAPLLLIPSGGQVKKW